MLTLQEILLVQYNKTLIAVLGITLKFLPPLKINKYIYLLNLYYISDSLLSIRYTMVSKKNMHHLFYHVS